MYVAISLTAATSATTNAVAAPSLDEQIRTLIAEKASRTVVQQKIDSNLLKMLRPERFQALPLLANKLGASADGTLPVKIKRATGANAGAIVNHLKSRGASVPGAYGSDDTIHAKIALTQIEALALAQRRRIHRTRPGA